MSETNLSLVLSMHMYHAMHDTCVGDLAQSEERNVSNVEAPGSKPGFSMQKYFHTHVNHQASLA